MSIYIPAGTDFPKGVEFGLVNGEKVVVPVSTHINKWRLVRGVHEPKKSGYVLFQNKHRKITVSLDEIAYAIWKYTK